MTFFEYINLLVGFYAGLFIVLAVYLYARWSSYAPLRYPEPREHILNSLKLLQNCPELLHSFAEVKDITPLEFHLMVLTAFYKAGGRAVKAHIHLVPWPQRLMGWYSIKFLNLTYEVLNHHATKLNLPTPGHTIFMYVKYDIRSTFSSKLLNF